jgi:hypothetical protein
MLPKCKSSTLTQSDKQELLTDLRKQMSPEIVDKLLNPEDKKDQMLTLQQIK